MRTPCRMSPPAIKYPFAPIQPFLGATALCDIRVLLPERHPTVLRRSQKVVACSASVRFATVSYCRPGRGLLPVINCAHEAVNERYRAVTAAFKEWMSE